MKKYVIVLVWSAIFLFIVTSCSKESDDFMDGNNQDKAAMTGDKIFVGDNWSNVFTYYPGVANFTYNSGGSNFTIADIPGTESYFKANGSGYFKYLNVNYPLTWGYSYRSDENRFFIGLADYKMELSGIISATNIAGFSIISGEADKITPGYYQLVNTQNPYTFYFAYIAINLSDEFDPEKYIHFEEGNIYISKSGNTTIINFNGMLEDGNTVSGNFTGQLTEIVSDQ